MRKAINILIVLSFLLFSVSCVTQKNITGDINDYSNYLEKVYLSEQYMPKTNELGKYSDVTITYRSEFEVMFETNTAGLYLSYDEANYEKQKNCIISNYKFFSPDDDDLKSDCDAAVCGYDIHLVRADYKYETYKTGLLIGTNDENRRICYLFYTDTELDILDDLDSFIEDYFYIP